MNIKRWRKAAELSVAALIGGIGVSVTSAGAHNSGTDDYEVKTADLAGSSTAADYALIGRSIVARNGGRVLTAAEATAFGTYLANANGGITPRIDMLIDYRPNRVPAGTPPTTTSTTQPTQPPVTTTTVVPTTTTQPVVTTTTAAPTTTTTQAPTTTSAPTTTTTAPPATSQFTANFSSAADFYDRFQLDVALRGARPGFSDGNSIAEIQWGKPMSGDHNHGCEGPTTQRTFTIDQVNDMPGDNSGDDHRNSQVYWWCAPAGPDSGHVMTGMGEVDGYTIVAFSPNQQFVNAKRVCWDVNLTAMSGRKWFGVAVISEAHYQAPHTINGVTVPNRRLDYVGDPSVDDHALNPSGGDFMFLFQDQNFRVFSDGTGYDPMGVRDEGHPFGTQDKAKRYKHCLVEVTTDPDGTGPLSGTVRVEQERQDGVIHSHTFPGSFPDNARVIFLDDSYTPGKDETVTGLTWHWDNISIS